MHRAQRSPVGDLMVVSFLVSDFILVLFQHFNEILFGELVLIVHGHSFLRVKPLFAD